MLPLVPEGVHERCHLGFLVHITLGFIRYTCCIFLSPESPSNLAAIL